MSDTPRTDALVGDFPFPWSYHMEMLVRHAEQLERELLSRARDFTPLSINAAQQAEEAKGASDDRSSIRGKGAE